MCAYTQKPFKQRVYRICCNIKRGNLARIMLEGQRHIGCLSQAFTWNDITAIIGMY